MPRLLVLLPPLIFAGLAGLFAASMMSGTGDELPSALVGQPAPALPDSPLGNLPLATAEMLRGDVTLVNFFASWCAPCRVEHPHLQALAAQGVEVLGVAYKDDPASAAAFLDELGNPYAAAAQDPQGRAALDWGVYGVPETFVVDAEGRVVARMAGPVTDRVLQDRLLPAMRDAQ
jgi:cytochrome c biogenesis protein CcmG/thiol:disulfide interchange protein DsbE